MNPTRVVHVVTSDQRRGAEVFAADLVRALAGSGIDQQVVVLRPAAGGGATVDFAAPTVRLSTPARAPLSPLMGALRLRRALAATPGAVVCAHGGEALRAAVVAGSRRIVYRRIGSAPPSITAGPRRRWHRWLMGRARLVLCVADAVREETVRVFGLPSHTVRSVPNGVDPGRLAAPDRDACRTALGLAADARVVLSLGSLSWEKDPLRAVAITRPARAAGPGVVHLFVGDGPLAPQVRESGAGRGGERHGPVVVLPARPDVGTVLGAADVLLLCSRPDGMEGMPAVVIEAGLAGVPVVADRIAGVAEVVVDGETGVLVAPGDDQAASAAVAALLADDDRRAVLGGAAVRRCQELFAIEPVAAAYRAAFEEVAAGHGRGTGPSPER